MDYELQQYLIEQEMQEAHESITATPTDRTKLVHNRCVIKDFGGVF